MSKIFEKIFEECKSKPDFKFITFQGKSDLIKNLSNKLKFYRNPDAHFVILHDKDSNNCIVLKEKLKEKCIESGKNYTIRIVCTELESWFLADFDAIYECYKDQKLKKARNYRKFRNPDNLGNPAQELKNLIPSYQKIAGAQKITPFLNLSNTRSKSFSVFIKSMQLIKAQIC